MAQIREDSITLHKPVGAREGRKHQPVLLPEPLTDHLLGARSICLGVKDSPIKLFISVTRCHRYLEYDQVAANCRGLQRCTLSSGTYVYTEYRSESKRKCCYVCRKYNEENKTWVRTPKNTNHAANSGKCTTHRTLLRDRQLQSERAWHYQLAMMSSQGGCQLPHLGARIESR